MNKIELMQQKLHQLFQQLLHLASTCERLPIEQKQRIFPLQEPQYSTSSYELSDYTKELSNDLDRLEHHINQGGSLESTEYLCEQLAIKFKQLHFALNRLQKLRYHPSKLKQFVARQSEFKSKTTSLYQKLTQQQDYERQLEYKIRERELQLKQDNNNNLQLQNEILALKQRLGRCNQATYQIETAILQFEKRQ